MTPFLTEVTTSLVCVDSMAGTSWDGGALLAARGEARGGAPGSVAGRGGGDKCERGRSIGGCRNQRQRLGIRRWDQGSLPARALACRGLQPCAAGFRASRAPLKPWAKENRPVA